MCILLFLWVGCSQSLPPWYNNKCENCKEHTSLLMLAIIMSAQGHVDINQLWSTGFKPISAVLEHLPLTCFKTFIKPVSNRFQTSFRPVLTRFQTSLKPVSNRF
jgi:hypothetical protein